MMPLLPGMNLPPGGIVVAGGASQFPGMPGKLSGNIFMAYIHYMYTMSDCHLEIYPLFLFLCDFHSNYILNLSSINLYTDD